MAILIGVIALAVIPKIQRSRESKDLTTLDNIMSACNVAAANAQLKKGNTAKVTYSSTDGTISFDSGNPSGFNAQYTNAIGDGKQVLSSGVGAGHAIVATVTIDSNNVASIVVKADGADPCKYTTDDAGNATKLEVKSSSAS